MMFPTTIFRKMFLRPPSIAGYAQIYILDPDRNIIEFNFETIGILTQLIQSHGENPAWKTDLDSVKKLVADTQP